MGACGSDQGMAPVDIEDDASGQFAAEKEAVGLGNVGGFRNPAGRDSFSHVCPHLGRNTVTGLTGYLSPA